ncbi:MAG: aminopeptidase [Lachnoclostridium sp.]|nr:aminopeptidase [Lachnoclostridium sp.]
MDARIEKLAKNLVQYSMKVKKGDNVYVHCIGSTTVDLTRMVIKEIYAVGAYPFPHYTDPRIEREMRMHSEKEQLQLMADTDGGEMERMDCYIGIRGNDNVSELSDVPAEKQKLYDLYYGIPVHNEIRVKKTRWVVLRYPNTSMAQLAGTSLEAFENFYFDVCNLDYSIMNKAMDSIKTLLDKTDRIRITGPDTDLRFSIKGIPSVKCAGECNIPDGEIYTAPVRNSVEGTITYNVPSLYQGFTFENVSLTFEKGKIVKATANDNQRINEIFDTDEGARYVGEFAIGVNPYITKAMKDILFDEKIMGSIHFTPGNCYDDAPNGNTSGIHWDLVLIQTPEYGGGEIYFDDVLVRKDGRFVPEELQCLNPENLK